MDDAQYLIELSNLCELAMVQPGFRISPDQGDIDKLRQIAQRLLQLELKADTFAARLDQIGRVS